MKSWIHLLTLSALAPAVPAQSVLHTLHGNQPYSSFGWSVRGAGDVNADGYADFIVGAHRENLEAGTARVYSGLDGSTLHTFFGGSPRDWFGYSVSGAGDVNGDGHADVIVGAIRDDTHGAYTGSARVFSGLDGSVLYHMVGDAAGDTFGCTVSGAGDVNGDGYADVIVGAAGADSNGTDSGRARIYSGLDGSTLYTFDGSSAGDFFGGSTRDAGDVNQDGHPDVIIGSSGENANGSGSGRARVFSGADGAILYTFDGQATHDEFGWSVSGAGDMNADGHADVIVGAPYEGYNGLNSGTARVFSGIDGGLLHTLYGEAGGDYFGRSVGAAGDINRDGYDDVIVGAYGNDNNAPTSGQARVFSGLDGSVLFTVEGAAMDDMLGRSCNGAGDVDGDGFADIIVASIGDDTGGVGLGTVQVFSGCSPAGTNYCAPAIPNSSGQPGTISACGSELVSGGYLTLNADQLPPGQFGYFLASTTQALVSPPGSQGLLCLGSDIGRFNGSVGQGPSFGLRIDLAAMPQPSGSVPVQPGDTWNFQCWFRDVGNTSNFTDAVSIVFQ